MYDRILLPTDGHAEMAPVTDHALELAEHFEATVYALYVAEDDVGESANGIVDAVAERGESLGVAVETAVRQGSPAETIRDYAREAGVDLVVMGTHGRTGIDRILTGSVAERVVRVCEIPVLTVHVGDGGPYVNSATKARLVARERLASMGYDDVVVEDTPSRQRSTWVVEATADGHTTRVHVNSATGKARVVDVGEPV